MSLKPVIKTKNSRHKVADWIVERFPEGYESMGYLEPFLGDGSVLLAKKESEEEVVSDPDKSVLCVWRAIRDEHSSVSSKVKRIDHSRGTFDRYLGASGGDYISEAVREFVLRQMSKNGLKKTYLPREGKPKCRDCWCDLLDRIPEVNKRISRVFFVDGGVIEMVRAFSDEGHLVFCDLPEAGPGTADFHSELGEALRSFRGKAAVLGRNCAMNKRIYSEWSRRGLPGGGNESLWVNF